MPRVLAKYLSEIVYGGSDGIITTFAVVAGFSGAQIMGTGAIELTFLTVLLFGFANLFADGLSMGLGNFLSVRSQNDLYRRRFRELSILSTQDLEGLITSAKLADDERELLLTLVPEKKRMAIELFLTKTENIELPDSQDPKLTGLATFLAFLMFGFIPLVPYVVFQSDPAIVFLVTIVATLLAMTALGLLRWRVSGINLGLSMIETVGLGSVAATAAFIVGTLFA